LGSPKGWEERPAGAAEERGSPHPGAGAKKCEGRKPASQREIRDKDSPEFKRWLWNAAEALHPQALRRNVEAHGFGAAEDGIEHAFLKHRVHPFATAKRLNLRWLPLRKANQE